MNDIGTADYDELYGPHRMQQRETLRDRLLREKEERKKLQAVSGENIPIIGPKQQPAEAPQEGKTAFQKIMDLSEKHAQYLEDCGAKAMSHAAQYEQDCLNHVREICAPMIEEAAIFQRISNDTAAAVRRQATLQAEQAIAFTTRIASISKTMHDGLNGDNGSTDDKAQGQG